MNRIQLEERLVEFSSQIINCCTALKSSDATNILTQQIIRSGISAALNYGEAQGAETKKDFIHKISVVLKELRETRINLDIILYSQLSSDQDRINSIRKETDELISIFFSTIKTAKSNLK